MFRSFECLTFWGILSIIDRGPEETFAVAIFSQTAGRKGPVYNYPCPYNNCSKIFFNQNRLNVHTLKSHKNLSRACQICGIKVTNNLDVNKRLYHKSKDCKECNITFRGVNAFQEHKRKVHGDSHCCQVFKHYSPLRYFFGDGLKGHHTTRGRGFTLLCHHA